MAQKWSHQKKSSAKTAIATYAYRLMLADADEISETFRDEVWRLWAVLESMEHDAHTVLKRQPVDTIAERPPITEIFSIRRHLANDFQGAAVIDFTEEEHLIAYCELPNLNEEQRNAIEALRSMWRIRVHIAAADQLDNGYPITTARSLCERIALEMMMLAFSFRGEFKTRLKPFLDRPALNKAKAES